MAGLTNSTVTAVDARGTLGYSCSKYLKIGRDALPGATWTHGFELGQNVLILYSRDGRWHEGKVVNFRSSDPGNYEVQFTANGPRIRNWFRLLDGSIKPDTTDVREGLEARGFVIVEEPDSCE